MLPISTPLAAALFINIWFTVLFAVLPFGVRSQAEGGDFPAGTDPGAPMAPRLLLKIAWTTGVSALVFTAFLAYVAFLA